jgi:hypothetical protein
MAASTARLHTGATIVAFACIGAAAASCLVRPGRARLTGWGLVLLAVAGMEISAAKPALFTLCGLLALAVASTETGSEPSETAEPAGS